MRGATQSSAPAGTKLYFVDFLGVVRHAPVVAFEHFETYPCPKPIFAVPIRDLPNGIPWSAAAYYMGGSVYPMDPDTPFKATKSLSAWTEYVLEERLFMRKEFWHDKRDIASYDGATRFASKTYWRVEYPHTTLLIEVDKGIVVPAGSEDVNVERVRRERWYDMIADKEGHRAPWPITRDAVRKHGIEDFVDIPKAVQISAPVMEPEPEPDQPELPSRSRRLL